MPDTEMTWQSMVDYSREHELLAKQLYVVFSEPTNGLGPILEVVDEHVRYQTKLEVDGIMWAAGPMATPDEREWLGDGCSCTGPTPSRRRRGTPRTTRCTSPGHGRSESVCWLLNEGSLNVRVLFSGGKTQVI